MYYSYSIHNIIAMTDNTIFILIALFIIIIVIYLYTYYFNPRSNLFITQNELDNITKDLGKPLSKDPTISRLRNKINQDIYRIIKEKIMNKNLQKIALIANKGGKRIRPIIAYSIVKKMNPEISDVKLSSLNAIELLHSASLMIDDMMDNDIERRGEKCPHVIYGNDITLLASTYIVMLSLRIIGTIDLEYIMNRYCKNKEDNKEYKLIINSVIDKTCNLIDGQTLDIENNKENDKFVVLDILSKKTASIFEMIFIMSWILGGGDPKKIPDIEKIANDFGIMFQIYDDYTDIVKDHYKGYNLNYVLRFGADQALMEYKARRESFFNGINRLNIVTSEIIMIEDYLHSTVTKISNIYNDHHLKR